MAQLKDLLVTGPARITGAVTFNQIPKCNTTNVALITDVTSAKEEAIEVADAAQDAAENAQTTADGAVTAAGDAQTRADEAYSLADSKTTMSAVEGKNYATKTEAQGYADEVLGTSSDGASTATVYGALAAADNANTNADGRLSKTGGTLTGNLVINNGTNPYLALYETLSDTTQNTWYIQGSGGKLYLGGSISANQYPTSIDKEGLLTAKNISTTTLSATSFSGEWKSGTTSVVHPGVSGTVALQGDLDIVTTVTNSTAAIVTDVSSSGMGISVTKSTLANLGLNTVYKYKGTKTWAQLKAITSATIGDVYSISDTDPEGNTNADWACYTTVTAATGDNYATYWQSLGGKIDLSPYAQKNASNTFDGEQRMVNSTYCPTMADIASGIGCSLKNTRALDNQAIIGEILLPTTNQNASSTDANVCKVTAHEMGIYKITSQGTDPNNAATYGKITGKTLIGTFTDKGWRGHAATLYDSTAGVLHWDGDYMLYPYDRSDTKLHFGTADLYKYNTTNGYIKLLDASNYTDYAPTKEGGGASGDWSINAASATLLKPTNSADTISYGVGTWGANVPATNAAIMWQQKFSNSAFNSDTGDIVLWLERQSESASVLNITLDGYFYQNLTKRVLDIDNISGEANWIPKFSNANSIIKGWQIKNMTGAGSSGWTNTTTDGGLIPTMNTLAYWNGAYNSSGNSNLAYCNQGAFSTMATKNASAMDCDILFSDSGTTFRQICGIVGTNDYWRIGGGASSSNNGYMEIATADDGTEPIYVRQYTGAYETLTRTLTLLDASGNSSFPGNVAVNGTINATSTITGSQFKGDNTAVAIRPSDSNEINFSSNATYIYFGYDNRTNSTGVIDTYKFGCHDGAINSCNGNIECGSVKLRSAATFTYNTTDKCIDVLF